MTRVIIALLATTLITGTSLAQDDTDNRRNMNRRGPPEAALKACESPAQGDPCSFHGRGDDVVDGTCETPVDKPLACAPEGGKRERLRDVK